MYSTYYITYIFNLLPSAPRRSKETPLMEPKPKPWPAIGRLRQVKSRGHDNIRPEFMIHQRETTSAWHHLLFIMLLVIQTAKGMAPCLCIALSKPGKPVDDLE